MPISFRLVSYLLPFIILIVLGFIVLANNRKRRANQAFALFTFAVSAWIASLVFADNSSSLAVVDLASRFAFVTAAIGMLVILYFAATMSGHRITRLSALWALPVVVFIVAAPTPLSIAQVSIAPYGANVQGGPIYTLFSIFAPVCLITAVVMLIRSMLRSTGAKKMQLRFLAYGLAISTVIALATNLLFVSLGSAGPASFLIFASLSAFAMIRLHLFDIRLFVARSLAYLLLLTTLLGLYGLGLLAIGNMFFSNQSISQAEGIVFLVLALVVAVTYQPLRRFFERVTDRFFFHDQYDAQTLLDQVSSTLASEILLEPLLDNCLKEICRQMRLAGGQFVVLAPDDIYMEAHFGATRREPITKEFTDRLHSPILVTDEESGKNKELLDSRGIRVSLALRAHGELVGYLFLDEKLSGEIFSDQDLAVLEILRKELAIAITNSKSFEEIAHFNVTLQERIRKATRRLSVANSHLKVLDKAKDDFISMASHQLGTPLTTISGFLTMAIDEDKNNMTPDQREYVTYAKEASQRMIIMAGDLLNVSRLSAGRFTISPAPSDLNNLIEQEISQLQAAAKRKGLKLSYTPPTSALPKLLLDESKTRQVIMNFIDNALYYTEKGEIHVELARDRDKVRLTVTDSGMGVPLSQQAKLFTKFYRADNAKSARPDGTGLGLYLAKQVIEGQEGEIIFSTQEGKGSTFGFSLPYRPAV